MTASYGIGSTTTNSNVPVQPVGGGVYPPKQQLPTQLQQMQQLASQQQHQHQRQQGYPPQRQQSWSSDCASRRMADSIHEEVKKLVSGSRLKRRPDNHVALVQRHDLRVGNLLGQGAFSEVHRVQLQSTGQIFAMKHLRPKLVSQPDNFRLAASELAMEAHFLASFQHPNIIGIRGWAANGVASFSQGGHDSFFLLLDCLEETLDRRIDTWQSRSNRRKSRNTTLPVPQGSMNPRRHLQTTQSEPLQMMQEMWRKFSSQQASDDSGDAAMVDDSDIGVHDMQQRQLDAQEEHLLTLEKLGVCTEIASALSYLHSQGKA